MRCYRPGGVPLTSLIDGDWRLTGNHVASLTVNNVTYSVSLDRERPLTTRVYVARVFNATLRALAQVDERLTSIEVNGHVDWGGAALTEGAQVACNFRSRYNFNLSTNVNKYITTPASTQFIDDAALSCNAPRVWAVRGIVTELIGI